MVSTRYVFMKLEPMNTALFFSLSDSKRRVIIYKVIALVERKKEKEGANGSHHPVACKLFNIFM